MVCHIPKGDHNKVECAGNILQDAMRLSEVSLSCDQVTF